jgi:hypothetical protein
VEAVAGTGVAVCPSDAGVGVAAEAGVAFGAAVTGSTTGGGGVPGAWVAGAGVAGACVGGAGALVASTVSVAPTVGPGGVVGPASCNASALTPAVVVCRGNARADTRVDAVSAPPTARSTNATPARKASRRATRGSATENEPRSRSGCHAKRRSPMIRAYDSHRSLSNHRTVDGGHPHLGGCSSLVVRLPPV